MFRRVLLPLLALALFARAEEADPAQEIHGRALALQQRGKWLAAKRLFERVLEDYPESPLSADAANRCGDNAYLGTTQLWEGGPSERRIDVAVMGDGFTIDAPDQSLEEKWAKLCVDVLWNEKAFSEYRNYFNIHFVRLASLEEGVDPSLSPEERRKIEERNRRRTRKRKTEYNTAIDCKAAGPQGQVMSDAGLVHQWLEIANGDRPGCGSDGFVIAFARFGVLGMGGGGIANVGRPDKSITVHEFGHAFSRLADEYQGNPERPPAEWAATIRAANAAMTDDPKEVPWAHFLEKRVKGVGVYEGGATFDKGVWRPARTCAMNAAGATAFCPVCREATILVIYEHVSPVDLAQPPVEPEVTAREGDATELVVVPMRPLTHRLEVEWYVARLPDTPPEPELTAEGERSWPPVRYDDRGSALGASGLRAQQDRSAYDEPPPGEASRLGRGAKGGRRSGDRHSLPVGKLGPGRYQVTARVLDPTPWVLKDDHHLLEERVTWTVVVVQAAD